jgi:hypothetical protein
MSKGSKLRPKFINDDRLADNWERTFGGKDDKAPERTDSDRRSNEAVSTRRNDKGTDSGPERTTQ